MPAARRSWTPRRSRSAATARYTTPTGYTLPTTRHGDRHLPVGRQLQRRHQQQRASATTTPHEQVTVRRGQPDAQHHAQPDGRHAGHGVADPDGHGHAGGRLQRDRHASPSRCMPGQHVGGHGDGHGQRQRHLQTPTGYTLPTTGTVTGTYQWDASYSGDTNNNAVSDNNGQRAGARSSQASPTLSTTPSPTAASARYGYRPLNDSATLAGGYNPTGTITFTLYAPGGTTVVDTETSRSTATAPTRTPTGYTLPTTVHGDRHLPVGRQLQRRRQQQRRQRHQRQRAGHCDDSASPTLTTSADPRASRWSTRSPTLTDTATLAGGYQRRPARSPSRSTPGGTTWWTRRRSRSAATAPTRRRPATRCRPRAR